MLQSNTSLVCQSFGKESEYRRVVLAILSYYAYASDKDATTYLFTDNIPWFEPYLNELPIHYVQLTPAKMKVMRGEIDFLHRMKIALIEEAFQLSNTNLLYFDSDTFFTADPEIYVKEIAPNRSFMHLLEYEFSVLKNTTFAEGQNFYQLITNQRFQMADGSEFEVSLNHSSWNAGVMMFHRSHSRFIPDVYALTNQFYPKTKNHASEQFAFSLILQESTTLKSCEPVVYHYWYNVKKTIIDEFLEQKMTELSNKILGERLKKVILFTKQLPGFFDNHLLTAKDNAIQAFNEDKFKKGFQYSMKALNKGGLKDTKFLKDVLYHIKRLMFK